MAVLYFPVREREDTFTRTTLFLYAAKIKSRKSTDNMGGEYTAQA
jgi:hypothetical protein